MKIALLSAVTSVHTHRWANGLASLGHDVHLISLIGHRSDVNPISDDVTVHYLSKSGRVAYFTAAGELRALLRDISPDILNVHYASGYGTLARRAGFHPTLLSVWGSDVYDFPSNPVCRAILVKNLRCADALASTSNAMARQTEKFIKPTRPIFITPFGVDTARFCPADKADSDVITIGTVKTLEEKYGIEYLIRAFAMVCSKMPDKKLMLKIYGKGSLLAKLRSLCAELGVADKVYFGGFIPNTEVPSALAGMDIVCVPSVLDSESFGVSAVEAMSCAVPVVVSDADGLKEVVRDGVTGFIVPRRDAAAMCEKLALLAGDAALRRRMGEAGRMHVLQNYSWEDNLRHMSDCLEKTLADFGR